MIQDYGSINELPEAAVQPDRSLNYRIVFGVEKAEEKEGGANSGLMHIARTVNLYEWAGMPREQVHLVAVVYGPATPTVLSNEAHRQKFGKENPNSDLIRELADAGVELYVCGQALLGQGYTHNALLPEVQLAVAALTVLPTYQLKGYALLMY